MPFPEHQLNDGERVVLDLRPHWWYFAAQVAVLVVTISLGVVVLLFSGSSILSAAAGVLILAALVWFGMRYVVWNTTNFVVTTDRLIVRTGVVSREGIEIPLERVNTVFFRQSLWERLIRSGDLVIESAGEMGNQNFEDIRRPLNVQNEIYRQMEDNENRKFDRVNVGSAPVESIPDQIAKLDELRRRGIVSDDEFEQKKRELLDRM
ncbi:MAG: PH domain-containing protein [Acidimicrobiales bacterium]